MLSSISWQHYLAAVIILTISYYGYVILRYYQTEIANLFNRKKSSAEIFAGVQSAPIAVMGKAKLDNGVTLADTEELQFSDVSPDDAGTFSEMTSPAGNENLSAIEPSQELVWEAGNLIDAFRDVDNKQEFLSLLRILVDSYKRYQEDIDLPATLERVVELAKDKLQFTIALSDLQNN